MNQRAEDARAGRPRPVRVACLHTARSNAAVFEAARRTLGLAGVTLRHRVRADLLAQAERARGPTPGLARRTAAALLAACEGADAVLLTCSTLGPAVAGVAAPVPVLRVDEALARAAVRDGGTVAVLCAAETTLAPTRDLFERAARGTGARVRLRLVPGAWAAFKAGDGARYFAVVAEAAEQALRDGAARVALAQASMAGAAALCDGRPVLSSPAAGLAAAVAAVCPPA